MTNYSNRTSVQRRNDRMHAMFDQARKVELFVNQWEQEQGYKPAVFQKFIAFKRIERGQSVREIIDALVAMRVA